ncbi:leucine--tRNA ligase [Patescibacteria group bacterium]
MSDSKEYDHQKIEPKWQKKWERDKIFISTDGSKKNKFYCLVEFPYPSSDGLHVGHPRSYTAIDIIARKHRLEGDNVLFPMGFDAFGLPTENYAIKVKRNPEDITKENITTFRRQLKSLGFSFDWDREVITSDPKYYRWTQWLFLQLYSAGLVYLDEIAINWCPSCKIGLANEEVIDGKCERCGTVVIKKMMKQWMFRITKYAQRLIDDLETVDYLDKIKTQQINWIGQSEGAEVDFKISNSSQVIKVFTTRPDTLFGATYMVLSPEHALIREFKNKINNWDTIDEYLHQASHKSDLERTELQKEKTGVELKGLKAVNPMNQEEIPIWVADYVLASYGTGAIMAVPAHDERDYEFANKFKLPIRKVIEAPRVLPKRVTDSDMASAAAFGHLEDGDIKHEVWTGDGKMINSSYYNGLRSQEAKKKIIKGLEKMGAGQTSVEYKLRDWIFSRQHYWGEPIPLIHCAKCGIVPVPDKDLPVKLPPVENYEPTDTGESPLAKIKDWVEVECPKCSSLGKRETDTMPNWAGSNWYFIRYCDPHNDKVFADKNKMKYWLPVDLYNGGMEHTTLHLLYSRFWYKALYDLKLVPDKEPYKSRISQGLILGEDGQKMSKSRGNVINPDDLVREYGADATRLYLMFMGPYAEHVNWSTSGILGVKRFIERIWQHYQTEPVAKNDLVNLIHQTIKKVSSDIDNFRFNTAVSALMIMSNKMQESGSTKEQRQTFLKLILPLAPHLAEELWYQLGYKKSIHNESWPVYEDKYISEKTVEIIIQVNGKLRAKIKVPADQSESDINTVALAQDNVKKFVKTKPNKIIYVKNKLINYVI